MTLSFRGISLSIRQSLMLIGAIAVTALTMVIGAGYSGIVNGRTAAQTADARQVDLRVATLAELHLANLSTLVSRRLNYEVFPARFKKNAHALLQSLGGSVDAVEGKIQGADEQKALTGLRTGLNALKEVITKIESEASADDEQKFIQAADAVVTNLGLLRRSLEQRYAAAAKEKDSSLDSALTRPLLIGALTMAVLIAIMLALGASIRRPLRQMTGAMGKLAAGNLEVVLPGLGRRDEIGEMTASVQVFRDSMVKARQLEAEQKESEAKAVAEHKAEMQRLADNFDAAVGAIVNTVSSSAAELEAAATTLTHATDSTQRLSTVVAGASEEASSNVQLVGLKRKVPVNAGFYWPYRG